MRCLYTGFRRRGRRACEACVSPVEEIVMIRGCGVVEGRVVRALKRHSVTRLGGDIIAPWVRVILGIPPIVVGISFRQA